MVSMPVANFPQRCDAHVVCQTNKKLIIKQYKYPSEFDVSKINQGGYKIKFLWERKGAAKLCFHLMI